jgi:hypothetical protein
MKDEHGIWRAEKNNSFYFTELGKVIAVTS